MKRSEFLTAVCKYVASNQAKGNVRTFLIELAANGNCRPVKQLSRSYSDSTDGVIKALKEIGVQECKKSKNGNYFNDGWFVINDAPKGGKCGTLIKINFSIY